MQCADCNGVYVGQTGRSLKARVQEHWSAWLSNNREKCRLFEHLINTGHTFDKTENAALLQEIGKGRVLNSLEEVEICKHHMSDSCTLLNEITYNNEDTVAIRMYKQVIDS